MVLSSLFGKSSIFVASNTMRCEKRPQQNPSDNNKKEPFRRRRQQQHAARPGGCARGGGGEVGFSCRRRGLWVGRRRRGTIIMGVHAVHVPARRSADAGPAVCHVWHSPPSRSAVYC